MLDEFGNAPRVTIPDRAIDGASLLYYADLVIGGGGTMNREAALLNVPVLSIFKGTEGAVDHWLKETGKIVDVEAAEHIRPYIRKRERNTTAISRTVLDAIVSAILRLSAGEPS
jgi:predicted glycosyltransferase